MSQPAVQVLVSPGTGYELLGSVVSIAHRPSGKAIEVGSRWARQAEELGRAEVVEPIRAVGREPFINLFGWVHTCTDDPSARSVLDALRAADPRELVLALVGHYRRAFRLLTPPETIRAAVDGSVEAQRAFRRTSYPDLGYWQRSL